MDISIFVAIRDIYSNNFITLIESIIKCNTSYTYEILVSCYDMHQKSVSLSYQGREIKVFKDEVKTGSVNAFNSLVKESRGKYIFILTDGVYAPENLFDIVEELKELESLNQKLIVTSFTSFPGDHANVPVYANMKNVHIMRFPCFSRESLKIHFGDVIFNPSFKHHFPDNWLGSFCHLFGETRKESDRVCLLHQPHSTRTEDDEYDEKIYKKLLETFKDHKTYDFKIILE